MKKIELDIVCKSCNGTGLYRGFAEGEGSSVVCYDCKGTGSFKFELEYEDFKKRKLSASIKWVYKENNGIAVGQGDGYKFSDFGGMSYDDWIKSNGKFPPRSEMREFVCPAWCYNFDDRMPKWCHDEGLRYGHSFSSCKNFEDKRKCWARWDKEFGDESDEETEGE